MASSEERELIALKNSLSAKKDQVASAKGTYNEVLSNIKEGEKKLKDLGINPANVDEEIEKLENKKAANIETIKSKIAEWNTPKEQPQF